MSVTKEPPKRSQTLEKLARDFAELGKREPAMMVQPSGVDDAGNILTPELWIFCDFESNGPLKFDRLAGNVAIVLGWGDLSEEDARNRLLDKAKTYLLEHQQKHNYIKVHHGSVWTGKYGKPKPRLIRTESVLIFSVCEAVADYLLYLDSQDEAAGLTTTTGESEEQEEENVAIVNREKVTVPTNWKKRDKVTHAQAAAILSLKQTRSIRQKVTVGKLRSAGTGYISVTSLLEFLDQKRPSPPN